MKILDKIQEVINQHELNSLILPEKHNNVYTFLKEYPEFSKDYQTEKNDSYLLKKYKNHIPKGWYGFDIGEPIIPSWNNIIEEVLEICIKADPLFEIHQIKLKFGGIRFYCGSAVIEDLHDVESLIENTLWDKALIY